MNKITAAIIPVLLILLTSCGKPPPNPAAGNTAFEQGDFKKAVEAYKKEYEGVPTDPSVAIRMAISYYEMGDYAQFFNTYNLYLDLSGAHQEFKPWIGAVRLLENKRIGGMSDKQIKSPKLLPPQRSSDLPHLTKMRLLKTISLSVTRDAETDEERALAILDFVLRNVRSKLGKGEADLPGEPIDILMRGFGVCDRSVWSYIELARQTGLSAHMIQLRTELKEEPKGEIEKVEKKEGAEQKEEEVKKEEEKKEGEQEEDKKEKQEEEKIRLTSPHSLVAVKLGKKYVFLDTYAGFAIKDPESGELMGLEDILNKPSVVDKIVEANPGYPLKSEYFKKALFAITLSPEALVPRMRVLQEMVRRFSPTAKRFPTVAFDARREIQSILASGPVKDEELVKTKNPFPYTFKDREYQADIWLYPFSLAKVFWARAAKDKDSRGFKYFRGLSEPQRKSKEFYTARLQQMIGQYSGAIKKYGALAKLEGPIAEQSQFNAGICYYENAQIDQAIDSFLKYLERFPEGNSASLSNLHLGLCYKKKGDAKRVKVHFEKVDGPKRVLARMLLAEPVKAAEKPKEKSDGAKAGQPASPAEGQPEQE
ncbi:MAG: tetratricopeptide repeat protein [Planctomycetota bacterium]|jgi:transglutaminase-like putative cysteine protease|nr:tetratricopeptide repeat protein [Planctomycetota bacterium]MDP7249318.1 tetratricopeptide repeat protein [Planctomycetota bacterium]